MVRIVSELREERRYIRRSGGDIRDQEDSSVGGLHIEELRRSYGNLALDFFFFKQKTAYEIGVRLVGSEMCIRDR